MKTLRTHQSAPLGISIVAALFAVSFHAVADTAQITVQADQPGVEISSNLFGIFFEEINHAGDGGLYAELVRNRSFEELTATNGWTVVSTGAATGQISVDTSLPLNTNNLHSLMLTRSAGSGNVGVANGGFLGMSFQQSQIYDLSLFARCASGFNSSLIVQLQSANGGQVYAQGTVSGLSTNWQRFSLALTPNTTDPTGRLVVAISQPGTVWLDVVSLFPRATFRGRTNGLRPDLANMLTNLIPAFVRFPGGCYVCGDYLTNAVRWKKSIGDISTRPGHWNGVWNYFSSDGLGQHEYLQLCEDLGAEPLFVINCGMAHNEVVPLDQMGPWVQDALDAIEYANGPTNSTWGALRAANGRPAPFNLKYIEIGNEDGGSAYNDRYALFYDAIKSNYPNVHIIADVWGGIPSSRPVEIMDEHYYNNASFFINNATKYDTYSRSGPKVYVGEYAVTSGSGNGNLRGALGEAAFMTGLERNADIVVMSSYAPLFAHVNGKDWNPDLIYFDSSRVYGTPSYYVQQMFSQNRGEMVLPTTVVTTTNATNATLHGAIGLGSWNTSVQYTNVVVTSNGVTLYQSDFIANGTNGWCVYKGTWSTNNGLYQQTAITTDCRSTTGDTNWANYTVTLGARKTGGSEGFLILFNWLDDNNWSWWNLGGWNNTQHGIERCVNGSKSDIGSRVSGAIQTDHWYDIRIVLTGSRIQCYLNGQLTQDVTYPSGLVACSSYAKTNGHIVVKAVNPYSQPLAATFNLGGVGSISPTGALIQLTSGSPVDENSLAAPANVFPVASVITNAGTNFSLILPANSLSVLRLQASGINFITNLLLQIPSPVYEGQMVGSTVLGQKPGLTNWINLTTNANHAITWSSANPNVATVDVNGNVAGVRSGTTSIIVTYAALGLSATQSVQVISVPTTLVHRYSFSETSGTSVADSIGGPAWNGVLPRGGAFANGQLTLSSNSQQYVQLPANILSNYTQVAIEAWVTFPNQLPVNCFFFGFGNTNNGVGSSYIFCAPRAGRIAITAGDWSGEQNAYSGADFSYHTNFHVVAVFNPPAGCVALYTNGILAGINNAVTVQLSSVNDICNYIGKSLYSADPYPDFNLDEFRIYNGALHADEIAATQVLGPEQLLSVARPIMSASAAGSDLTLSWPLASAGFTLLSRTNLISGEWTVVTSPTPQISGSQWQVIMLMTGSAQYFRLRK